MTNLEFTSSFIDHVKLRFLDHNDVEQLKKLCTDWFPITYPDGWYKAVTKNPKFFSLAAIYNNVIIGVIVAEIRNRAKEDEDILGYWYPSDTKVGYILVLGTSKEYRRKGIASILLKAFLSHVNDTENHCCKAVYLHVLSTNAGAVLLYERHQFLRHKHLPLYYAIQGTRMDGYCYVIYANGGCPPWTTLDFISATTNYFSQFAFCRASSYLMSRLWVLPRKILLGQKSSRIIRNL
ncbi:N-alpha-acetyltransferase 60-like [Hydractinia symbiolongicarpus]|uniref:N-alpha-acetyltransferase 60-like n=1 Tax=Hydractinia symbiolongicarpus TaxID=13093 RepID=UPI00255089BF|nr:N-alpha-acetyltransferase 60-like [Hydractinia symbiolongicarpus]